MKGITELDTIPFLAKLNEIRKVAADCIGETEVLEIRKRMPIVNGNESPEQLEKMRIEQGKKNVNAILDSLLEKHPEATIKLLECMIVYDEGEQHLTGIKLVSRALREIMDDAVIDFLLSAAKLGINV